MLHEYLDSRFLFPNPLLPLGDFLMKFSEQSLFPVAVRSLENNGNVNNMKIIMQSSACGEVRGFNPNTMAGMTMPEILDTLSIEPKEKEAELKAIDENDQVAIQNNCQNAHNQVTLDAKGFIRIFQRIVTPLAGYNGKIVALSTTSLELTQYTNLLYLLELYKRYYPVHEGKESQAIEKFSAYLKLNTYFTSELTLSELTALLAMATDARHKQAAILIASFLKKPCTPKTISTYASLLKDKLKDGIDLHAVFRSLRDYYQLQPMLFQNAGIDMLP